MAVQLSKGQRVDLTKGNKLSRAVIGLGWDVKKFAGGYDFDLDASAFLTNEQNKVTHDGDFIFYNNLKHSSGAVEHTGDNRTGVGEGDDESIIIDFHKMPSTIHKVGITVTIHDAQRRGQNFGQVYNAYVRVLNEETGEEILRFDLAEEFSIETALIVCELYRYQGEWRFSAVGSGFSGGLSALCQNYGLEVE